MARIDVIMPQMGESIAEGTLSRWLKKVGDELKRDEPMFEISTDKVDAEIPAPAAGVLAEILVQQGETVPVQTLVARIETDKSAILAGGTDASAPAPVAASVAAPPAPSAPLPTVAAPAPVPLASAAPVPQPAAAAARLTPDAGAALGGGNGTASFEQRVRTRSSPLVRKIAAQHGVDISGLSGSGIAGRVTKRDLLGYIEGGLPARGIQPDIAQMPVPMGSHSSAAAPSAGDRVEPMSRMRALISEHMVASRRTSAHVTSFFEVDFTRVARIRAAKRRDFEAATGEKLSYMPFIISAVVQGIRAFPILNSSVTGTDVVYHGDVNIGIAVALDWGLIVPVIRHADNLSLSGITRSLNDLAARARAKKLSPEEVQGGTFTITNPGVFGSLMGTPIINQPQVAIMGVGAIEKRPKVITGSDGEDTIAIRTCAYFSLSFDHRVIDGAVADQFMAHVKKAVETFSEAAI